MSISFNTISADIRTPGQFIEFDSSRAVQTVAVVPNVTLIIGQRRSTGTIPAETLVTVPSATKGEEYFGHGSILAQMIEVYKDANPYVEVWAIALDDEGAGVAATGTLTWSGTATEDGIIYLYLGGERITVAIPSGTAAAVAGPLVVSAVTAHVASSNLPVSASGGAAVTTITFLHKGTLGNGLDIRLNHNSGEALPAGLACAIVDMASGATDPDVADAIAVMGDGWFTTVVSAYADDTNQDKLEAEALARWHPMVQQDMMCFIGAIGNQSTLTSAGNARNNKFTVLMGGGESPSPAWVWAANAAAVDTGEPDPARPRQTLALTQVVAPARGDEFTQTERATLLTDGVSTFTVDPLSGTVAVERMITTYQTNGAGVADVSYLDITTMRTLAYLRYSLRARIALRFPRHKLASDGTLFSPGQAVATPATIKSEILALFRQWELAGLVEDFEQFKTDIIVERSTTDVNRVDVRIAPDLLNQFRVFAGQIQFIL